MERHSRMKGAERGAAAAPRRLVFANGAAVCFWTGVYPIAGQARLHAMRVPASACALFSTLAPPSSNDEGDIDMCGLMLSICVLDAVTVVRVQGYF